MKRLVICADGTWNQRDQIDDATGKRRPTNVTKIARAVVPLDANGVTQMVIYHDGLGTGGPLDKATGGAFGTGIEDNVRNLYRSIVYNYSPGDDLFFLGFSRGAFTVRTLAGFLNRIGLIEKDDDYFLPEMYACYEANCLPGSEQWKHAFRRVANSRDCPPIKFIGVWDTVGALGAPGAIGKVAGFFNGNKYAYHDVGLNPHIQNAYQALAIDEQRGPFQPTLFKRPVGWSGQLQQVWFPGVHCNVGGGYTPDGLANEALHWVAEKAESHDLELDSKYLAPFRACFNSKRHDSMSPKYRALGKHLRSIGENLEHGEAIHQSALDRLAYFDGTPRPHEKWAEQYAPINLQKAVQKVGVPIPVVDTHRIKRGSPCVIHGS